MREREREHTGSFVKKTKAGNWSAPPNDNNHNHIFEKEQKRIKDRLFFCLTESFFPFFFIHVWKERGKKLVNDRPLIEKFTPPLRR